jgi:hypothetical protein
MGEARHCSVSRAVADVQSSQSGKQWRNARPAQPRDAAQRSGSRRQLQLLLSSSRAAAGSTLRCSLRVSGFGEGFDPSCMKHLRAWELFCQAVMALWPTPRAPNLALAR